LRSTNLDGVMVP